MLFDKIVEKSNGKIANHLVTYFLMILFMFKLFDKIVEKSNGKITYHLITYFLMIVLISLAFLFVIILWKV
jgi:heme/copper-type cytochrome/quinol oxidase subunit 4